MEFTNTLLQIALDNKWKYIWGEKGIVKGGQPKLR